MAGLLDSLMGNNGAVSPWGVLYPSPQAQGSTDDFLSALRAGGETGQAPGQTSPFGDPSQLSVPSPVPAAPAFGAGAAPFSFAPANAPTFGAASTPASVASPAVPSPAALGLPAAPAVAQVPPSAPTDASSINRTAPAAPDQAEPIAVGKNYQMPRIGAADDFEPDDAVPAKATPTQGALPAAAAPAAAPFSLGGAGDRLGMSTRGFIGNLHNGPIAAIAGGLGSLITGRESDPSAIAQGKLNATGAALLAKGVPAADVQAAINNPDVMKTLVTQYFGPDKFQHVTRKDSDGNEIPGSYDPTTGKYKWENIPADATGGTVMGPNGPIQIPAGVNRKEFVKRISEATADAATGKKTEAQAKASSFAARMQQAEQDISKLQNEGLSAVQGFASGIPGVGNYLQSTDHQKFETAKSAFITALLRQESGAAINKSEFSRYEKELFPQPGDAPQVVKQKAQLRAAAIEQMKGAAGPGYQPPAAPAAPAASGKTSNGISWSVQ